MFVQTVVKKYEEGEIAPAKLPHKVRHRRSKRAKSYKRVRKRGSYLSSSSDDNANGHLIGVTVNAPRKL